MRVSQALQCQNNKYFGTWIKTVKVTHYTLASVCKSRSIFFIDQYIDIKTWGDEYSTY